MPHIIIEYSSSLATTNEIPPILQAVHRAVVATELFQPSHIKIRALAVEQFLIGGKDQTFIHGQLRIKSGRSTAQKKRLSEQVLQALCEQSWQPDVVTVEVLDMDNDSYAKFCRA